MNAEPTGPSNVFLIGYRCTGKTSVGKSLAARLGWFFVDTDELLVAERQTSIKEIVDSCGWETFRKLERDIVKQVCGLNRQVAATGGGVVLDEANVRRMQAKGKLVWLRARAETIRSRMMRDANTDAFRPALTSRDTLTEIEDTLLEREPVYRRAMDFYVHTDNLGVEAIVHSIIESLKRLCTDIC